MNRLDIARRIAPLAAALALAAGCADSRASAVKVQPHTPTTQPQSTSSTTTTSEVPIPIVPVEPSTQSPNFPGAKAQSETRIACRELADDSMGGPGLFTIDTRDDGIPVLSVGRNFASVRDDAPQYIKDGLKDAVGKGAQVALQPSDDQIIIAITTLDGNLAHYVINVLTDSAVTVDQIPNADVYTSTFTLGDQLIAPSSGDSNATIYFQEGLNPRISAGVIPPGAVAMIPLSLDLSGNIPGYQTTGMEIQSDLLPDGNIATSLQVNDGKIMCSAIAAHDTELPAGGGNNTVLIAERPFAPVATIS